MNEISSRLLASLLETRTGQQLTMSRRWRIETALQSLMRARSVGTLDQLMATLVTGRDPALTDQIVEALLNNETYFFRDRTPFQTLLGEPLRRLELARTREKRLNIWCAGCSTGQEVYSLAMSFAEQAPRWQGWTIDILGSDVSGAVIPRAQEGRYSQFEIQRGLPVLQMIRWFEEKEGEEWQIADRLRQSVRFEVHNLLEAPPRPGQFDIILCRNVLLYFSEGRRGAVFARLAEAARADGVLMLGAGETVIGQTEAFVSDSANRGLYIKPVAAEAAAPRRYGVG